MVTQHNSPPPPFYPNREAWRGIRQNSRARTRTRARRVKQTNKPFLGWKELGLLRLVLRAMQTIIPAPTSMKETLET
ncbi:hypothetical protein I7I50_10277 [Histoplasma capsulatum G186AR]|uniref:Uncharacterized protein n=1 Tax=Ajellomyces capsulatus TaxID=5037 RepID=A0A8H8D6B5_AJECA|nr:hypothetical protein I7I52_01516 [Histoplasma capsulatum]QSS69097.1 hypothetical protein I7I50_10277 [Histoplasma capsulatum G186AR]